MCFTTMFADLLYRIQSKSAGGSGGGSGGEQERLLVEEITAPGGVRAAPPRDVLNNFITRSVYFS